MNDKTVPKSQEEYPGVAHGEIKVKCLFYTNCSEGQDIKYPVKMFLMNSAFGSHSENKNKMKLSVAVEQSSERRVPPISSECKNKVQSLPLVYPCKT